MTKYFFTGLEELEVEKVYNEEKDYNNSSNSEDLEKTVQQNIDDSDKNDDGDDKESNPTDEVAADTDPDLSGAMESYYEAIHVSMALEEASVALEEIPEFIKNGVSATGDLAKTGIVAAGKGLLAGAAYLKDLGVDYGPKIAKAVGKATLYSIEMTLKGLYKGSKTLYKVAEKSIHSYKSFDNKAEKLKKSVAILKNAKKTTVIAGKKYTKEKIIQNIIIDHKLKPLESIKIYQTFIKDYVMKGSNRIDDSISGIKIMVGKTALVNYKQPTKYMGEQEASAGLIKKEISGYEPDSEYVDSYIYPHTLPGNTLLISYLPKKDLADMDQVYDAYHNSQIFLGKNTQTISAIYSVEYGTLSEVEKLLTEIQVLCRLGLEYGSTFKHIEKQRSSIKYSLKGLLDTLIKKASKEKADSRMTEAISLKVMFIDKCFIGSMADIENYTRLVIRSYLDYCSDSLVALSKS